MEPSNETNDGAEAEGAAPELSLEGFRAELEVFSGPLDLLLHLIRQDEVDVLEVPVSHITEQYLEALRTMQLFEVNVAAEFLVMAATLMDIKSRMLLPERPDEDEEEVDPRDALVQQLLQYKRFKLASGRLAGMAEERALRFARPLVGPQADAPPVSPESLLKDVSIWDLLSAYGRVVRQIQMSRPAHIVYDEVPIAVYMAEVMERLRDGQAEFLDFFSEDRSRQRVIGIFLALLELVRQSRIVLRQQEGDRTQIAVTPPDRPAAPHQGAARRAQRSPVE